MSFPSKFFVIDFVGTARPDFFAWLASLETETPMGHLDGNNPWKYLEAREYSLMVDLFRSPEPGYSKNRRVVLEPETRHVEIHIEAIIPGQSLAYQHWIEDIGDRLISQHTELAMKPIAWVIDGTFTSVDAQFNRTNQFVSFQYPLPRDWILPWMMPTLVLDNWDRCRAILHAADQPCVQYEDAFLFLKDMHRHCTISGASAFLKPETAARFEFEMMNKFGDVFLSVAGPALSEHFTSRSTANAESMLDPIQVKKWVEGTHIARIQRGL